MAAQNESGLTDVQAIKPINSPIERTGLFELSFNPLNLLLCLVGAGLHLAAYFSSLPIVVAGLFYGLFYPILAFTRLGGTSELKIFSRLFAIGWVAAGVAAIYATHFNDTGQLYSDAAGFFEMATSQARGLSLIEIELLHAGALAIVLWSEVYDLFGSLGFPRERYVGITVNVTAVALSGVTTLKMARMVYGDQPYRLRRLTLMFSASGLLWLFAGIHVRDSIVLLAVTLLGFAWLKFLSKPSFGVPLLKIVGASLLTSFYIGFLRSDFVFVPLGMAMAAAAALLIVRSDKKQRLVAYGMAAIGLTGIVILLFSFSDEILYLLSRGSEGYAELAFEQHGADSLGMSLIINQPLPVRILMGSGYLFLFPIPFWSGFQLESAYALFKSFNVIFFYFLIPLLLMAIWQICRKQEMRSVTLLFLVFLSLGFTIAIAGTSLETRHFGVFLPYIFLIGLLPDLRKKINLSRYKKLLLIVIAGVLVIHLSWVILKWGNFYLVLTLLYLLISSAALTIQKTYKYLLLALAIVVMVYLAYPLFK